MQIKNLLIQCLIKLLKPWMGSHAGNRFLIVSTTGLGDTLWGTPALRALRQAYPAAYIAALTSPIGAEVLHNNPHLNEIFSIKSTWSLIRLLPRLRKQKFATIFMFHTSQRFVLPLCSLLGASRIVGTENINKGLDSLLTECLPFSHVHEIERRLQIVGIKTTSKQMEIFPSDTSLSGMVIGMHPGAKDLFKQWPPSHFIKLGQQLHEKLGCTIVVTGSPFERALVEKVASAIPGAKALYQAMPIPDFAAVIRHLSLFITNDTGPLHIACACKTPTIALFTPTDPELCGPYFAPHVHVVQKKPTCFPCLRKKCREPFCLLQISPDEVLKAALTWVKK